MHVGVKICGVTDPGAIEAAAAAGADAVGFVFAPSLRQLSPRAAVRLARSVPPGLARVGVLGASAATLPSAALAELALDLIQADAAACAELAVLAPGCRLLPVFHDVPDVERALEAFVAAAAPAPPLVLFEGRASGRGMRPDWDTATRLARRTPLALAGGLAPENVAAAILKVRPAMVDVSSGVESAPGVKDPRRIRAFVAEVRAAESQLAEIVWKP